MLRVLPAVLACFAISPSAQGAGADEVLLIQRAAIATVGESREVAPEDEDTSFTAAATAAASSSSSDSVNLPPSWSTGPFGDCSSFCEKPLRARTVECRSFEFGTVLPDSKCSSEKPNTHKNCNCFLQLCKNISMDCGAINTKKVKLPSPQDFQSVGCFRRIRGDHFDPQKPCTDEYDFTCLHPTKSICRSGFPFYRRCDLTSPEACSAFCVSKGLDVSAIVGGAECRCGASLLNQQAWQRHEPKASLLFQVDRLRKWRRKNCPLQVFRYDGYYESKGLPINMRKATLDDEAYIDSIIKSHRITADDAEGVRTAVPTPAPIVSINGTTTSSSPAPTAPGPNSAAAGLTGAASLLWFLPLFSLWLGAAPV